MQVESMMMAIAPLVPHYLMGIAAGAGLLGIFMLTCGFFQPASQLPRPVLYYPLHYLAFHTYSFYGFMKNEFVGTGQWGCPCSIMPDGCSDAVGAAACSWTGEQVTSTLSVLDAQGMLVALLPAPIEGLWSPQGFPLTMLHDTVKTPHNVDFSSFSFLFFSFQSSMQPLGELGSGTSNCEAVCTAC